jgi:type III secretory pathway lipoprotein EscJ
MKTKIRTVEIEKDKTFELPKNAKPLKLERIIEPNGLVNPSPSEDRFRLYYLQEE